MTTIAILHKGVRQEIAAAARKTESHPSLSQIRSGNYRKGRFSFRGLSIAIENPRGSIRRGVDHDGHEWQVRMHNHYGYFTGFVGSDGDAVDVFIGPHPESQKVYVVNQVDPSTGKFDEHKTMVGFDSLSEARHAYLSNYEKGWKGCGSIVPMQWEEFRSWLKGGDHKNPVRVKN